VLDYSEKNEKFKVKSGIVEGRLFTFDELKALSKLPSRNVLLGMMAGTLQAPMSKLAGSLHATVAQFAYALEAVKNKKTA
jgi:large subunit ribosomal protein L10